MSKPKISIIVPVYNTEKYLKRCVDSILSQTLSDIEVILVDDGSRQECADMCDGFASADSRIRVIHKENAGPGYARNAGLKVAKGEYIGFVDSDDYVKTNMYEILYNAGMKYDADMVISGTCFVGGNMFGKAGEYAEKSYFDADTVFGEKDMKTLMLGVVGSLPHEADDSRYGVSVWKNIFKNSLIGENGIEFMSEREILSEDTLFIVDFLKYAKSAVGIPGAYYCYCRNEDSISKAYKKDRIKIVMAFLDMLEKKMQGYVKKEEYKLYLDRLIQGYGRILCTMEIMHARDKKIKYSELRKNLNGICTNYRIGEALKTYPWYKLPKKQAAYAFAMKYKLYFVQKMMVILRDR